MRTIYARQCKANEKIPHSRFALNPRNMKWNLGWHFLNGFTALFWRFLVARRKSLSRSKSSLRSHPLPLVSRSPFRDLVSLIGQIPIPLTTFIGIDATYSETEGGFKILFSCRQTRETHAKKLDTRVSILDGRAWFSPGLGSGPVRNLTLP